MPTSRARISDALWLRTALLAVYLFETTQRRKAVTIGKRLSRFYR